MAPKSRRSPAHQLPPNRIPFAELCVLFGISRATLQRKYRPGNADPEMHLFWAGELDIRRHALADHGATDSLLHACRRRCEEHALTLQGQFGSDELAV